MKQINKDAANAALMECLKAYRAFKNWHDWCDGLIEAKKAAGLFEQVDYDTVLSAKVEREYMKVNPRPKMPAKNRKYRMYDNAYRAAVFAGLSIDPGSIQNMEGIFRVMGQVTAALAVAEVTE
jgi:hypothetical protein